LEERDREWSSSNASDETAAMRGCRVTPAAAAPVRNCSATGPNARNSRSTAVRGGAPRRGGVGTWAVVVGIDDRCLSGGHEGVFGVDLAGDRLDDPQDPVPLVNEHRDSGADHPVLALCLGDQTPEVAIRTGIAGRTGGRE
jgi:hypothetical protein